MGVAIFPIMCECRDSVWIHPWQEFWDGFKGAVHDDVQLAKVDKFKYLRNYLEEPAKRVTSGFALTDTYSAIDLLRSRYAEPGVIQRAHTNGLINVAPVINEKSIRTLRNLRNHIATMFARSARK